jgi:hypothetical protein
MRNLTHPLGSRARGSRLTPAIHAAALLVVGLTLASASPSAGDVIDRVLAIVSGEVITQSDVQGALALGLVDGANAADPVETGLRGLIDRTLMLAEVRRFVPSEPGAKQVEARIEQMRTRFASPAAMAQALAASGIDEERLRLLARDDLRITAYLAERFAGSPQPTEQQVEEYVRAQRETAAREGRALTFEEAQELARQQLAGQRRQGLIVEWIADLRQRADIIEPRSPQR